MNFKDAAIYNTNEYVFPFAKIQKFCIFASASPTRPAPADSPRMGT